MLTYLNLSRLAPALPLIGGGRTKFTPLFVGDLAEAFARLIDNGEASGKTLELGGTITGEHGVGLAKKEWLRQQMGDSSFEVMKQIKRALDPGGLLNPGKIFD